MAIEVLHFPLIQNCGLEGVSGTVGAVDDKPRDHAFQLAPVKGLPLTGFGKLEFSNDIRFIINLNFEAFPQVTGTIQFLYLSRNCSASHPRPYPERGGATTILVPWSLGG